MEGQIVPWFDSNEWFTVYNNLYSSHSTLENKKKALQLLTVWKARCPFLPTGIESTLGLLQVHVYDAQSETNSDGSHYVLQLAYSSAIIRLVNHLLDSKAAKGATLYQAAKSVSLPDWIIDLRHDAAHSNSLASLELLRDATVTCLEWLHSHYWEKHKECISNYQVGKIVSYNGDDDKVITLANLCIAISICAHPQCTIKRQIDLPQEDMQEWMIEAAKELFGDSVDPCNAQNLSIKYLTNLMNTQSKKWLQTEESKTNLIRALLDKDLFLSLKIVQDLGGKEFYKNNSLSRHYMRTMEVLLHFLHTKDLILKFILELIAVTQQEDIKHNIRKLAALWIQEILKALRKTKLFLEKYNRCKSNDENFKRKTDWKTKFQQWFPNEDKRGIILSLLKPVPPDLTNRDFVYKILSVYNPYLNYYARDILNLVHPPESSENIDMMCTLANIISVTKVKNHNVHLNSKIYTMKDLTDVLGDSMSEDDESAPVSVEDDMKQHVDKPSNLKDSIWRVATEAVNWSTCPIGVLPWQKVNIEAMEI